eukprot:2812285-Prymnesium_polylepis.1
MWSERTVSERDDPCGARPCLRRRRVDVSERLLRVAAHFNLSFRDVYAVAFGWTPLSEEATARKAMVEADVDGDGAGSSAGSLDAQATAA